MADDMTDLEREDLGAQNLIEDAKYDTPPQEEPDPWDDDDDPAEGTPSSDPWASRGFETGAPF